MNGLRLALSLCAALAVLAGCGGSQSPIGLLNAPSQSRSFARSQSSSASSDLLYVSNDKTNILVYYWPSGKPFETIDWPAFNLCSDSEGNVWVVDETLTLVEYAHGGKRVIKSLEVPGNGAAFACSVDPSSGNLAVSALVCSGSCHDVIAVFTNAQGAPTIYTTDIGAYGVGYDNTGNLFADGPSALAELPKDGSSFIDLSINEDVRNLGTIQSDGQFLAVEGDYGYVGRLPVVYQMQVSGTTATVVNTVSFSGIAEKMGLSSWLQGGRIAIPFQKAHSKGFEVGIWRYPDGGKIRKLIDSFNDRKFGAIKLTGVTVSVAPHR